GGGRGDSGQCSMEAPLRRWEEAVPPPPSSIDAAPGRSGRSSQVDGAAADALVLARLHRAVTTSNGTRPALETAHRLVCELLTARHQVYEAPTKGELLAEYYLSTLHEVMDPPPAPAAEGPPVARWLFRTRRCLATPIVGAVEPSLYAAWTAA